MSKQSLPVVDSARTEFGFNRTRCDCLECTRSCHHIPGYLIPSDLERMHQHLAPDQDLRAWAKQQLLASPGALVLCRGKTFRIHTLVPARRLDGACIFLTETGQCAIHAVSPFGCSFFDSHMTTQEADRRSIRGLQAVLEAWDAPDLYAHLWVALASDGLVALPPEVARQQLKRASDDKHPQQYVLENSMIPDLTAYHWIVLNSSAGKDSQAMLDYVVEQTDDVNVPRRRLIVAHADLGRVEWPGTRELAEEQARHYGLAFVAVSRAQGDLLDHIAHRGKFPSPVARYCTSDHKRGQILRVFTRLAECSRQAGVPICRILNCLGLRAEESPARAQRHAFTPNEVASNGRRWVDDWLPLHAWTTEQVWQRIKVSGVRYHPAYDLGMPRLSCCFCIFSPRSALLLAGKHNPELLAEYVAVEKQIGHRFRKELSLTEVQEALAKGEQPGRVSDWLM